MVLLKDDCKEIRRKLRELNMVELQPVADAILTELEMELSPSVMKPDGFALNWCFAEISGAERRGLHFAFHLLELPAPTWAAKGPFSSRTVIFEVENEIKVEFGMKPRHDLVGEGGKAKRGWAGLDLGGGVRKGVELAVWATMPDSSEGVPARGLNCSNAGRESAVASKTNDRRCERLRNWSRATSALDFS